MKDPNSPMVPRAAAPTHKSRNAVQRSVTALLDELAPERALKRIEVLQGPIEQHRSPNGCVLQAAGGAVSVSWFAEEDKESPLGALHVIVWRGTVARRGATRDKKGAIIVNEVILHPIEPAVGDHSWRATDGSVYSTATLAEKCHALLQELVGDPE